MKFIITLIAVFSAICLCAQPAGYGFGKQILIESSKVSGTTNLTNFPVLVSLTDDDLRTTANGGNVENANGYDIVFTSGDCTTLLDHEIEDYDASTGKYIAWVRIPSLPATANYGILMYYGNSSVSTNPSTTDSWSTDYLGVYHFNNSVLDGTSNSNNLTDNSTTNLTSSKIGEGRDINNSTNVKSSAAGKHLVVPNGILSGVTNFTFSGWVYLDRDDTYWERIFDFGQNSTYSTFFTPSTYGGSPDGTKARITITGNAAEQGPDIANPSANTGNWLYWAVTIDNSTTTMSVYRNGSLYGSSNTVTLTPNSIEPTTANYFGKSQYGNDNYIDAKFDEFRLSSNSHSADWIATEYNNQNSPSTFYSVSAEYTAANLCMALAARLTNFNVNSTINNNVSVLWTTASEINNHYFTIERTKNGDSWNEIADINGAGNSTSILNYSYSDEDLSSGQYYYRLKLTNFDGQAEYSQIRSVAIDTSVGIELQVYPNPSDGIINVTVNSTLSTEVFTKLSDISCREIFVYKDKIEEGFNSFSYDLSGLYRGAFLVTVITSDGKYFDQTQLFLK